MKPGIHTISAAEYHADPCDGPSLSSSIANVLLRQSPLHAWRRHPRLNARHVEHESVQFDYGTAAHAMLLENDRAALVVVDADDWRSKAAREARDAARAIGKVPILSRQLAKVEAMVLEARDFLGQMPEKADTEHTIIWQEPGAWCRARPDWMPPSGMKIVDYKSTTNAEPSYVCDRVLVQMGYDVQAAFYLRGLRAATGNTAQFIFLFQEVEPPHACSMVALSPAMLAIAEKKVERAIAIWTRCLAENRWPAYDSRIHYAEPTPWQLAQAETMEISDDLHV